MYTYVFEVHVHDQAFILLNFLSLQPHDPRVPYVMVTKKINPNFARVAEFKDKGCQKKNLPNPKVRSIEHVQR